METEESPLEMIFYEIEKALEIGLPYLALSVSLTIPDICSRLQLPPNNETKKPHYVGWCEEHFFIDHRSQYKPYLTADDLYHLRCGVVHQAAATGHRKMKERYKRILFIVRQPGVKLYHRNMMSEQLRLTPGRPVDPVLDLDTAIFCRDMIDAAHRWYKANKDDAHVKANLPDLVRYRPEGYPPFRTVPLIA